MKKNLEKLYNNVENSWEQVTNNVQLNNIQKVKNVMVDIEPSEFISEKIVNSIKNSTNNKITFNANLKTNNKIYESFITIYSKKKVDIKNIACIALFLPVFFKINKKTNITLIMNKSKKKLPKKKGAPLGIDNVNSGFSYMNNIVIYREEEHEKLLLHEVIHALNLDSKNYNSKAIQNQFNLNSEVNINEGFTEFWASLLYTIIWTIKNQSKKSLETNINNEITFSNIQIAKILNHFNFSNAENLLLKKDKGDHKFKQETSVFSYYIVKGCLISNYDSWCTHPKKKLFTLNENTENKIVNQLQNKRFIKEINNNMNHLKNETNNFLINTMRMTYHG